MRLLSIMLLVPILLGFQGLGAESMEGGNLHTSEEADYSINFPQKWEVMEGVMGTDVIALAPTLDSEDLFRENANVITSKFDFPLTKEEFYSYNIKSLNELLESFNLESSEDVNLGGIDAKRIQFNHQIGVVNAQVIQYLILIDNQAFVISFTADPIDYPKIKGEFEAIANSFRFAKSM